MKRAAAFAGLLAITPSVASAETTAAISVPGVYGYIRHVVVETGTSLAVGLPPGESIMSAIVGDPGWNMTTALSGDGAHLTLKPTKSMPTPQLVQIYGSTRTWFLVVSSPEKAESTTYTVTFYDPHRKDASKPKPQTKQIAGCKANDPRYVVKGDKRIIVSAVCEDDRHTLIVVRMNRDSPNALPYSVDSSGRQDRIGNTTPAQVSPDTYVWTFDGKYRHIAMVSDSNRGQIRKAIDFEGAP